MELNVVDKEIVSAERDFAVYDLHCEVLAIVQYDVPDYEDSPYDPEEKEYFMIEWNSHYQRQTIPLEFELEFSFEDGLQINFAITNVKIPDSIVVPCNGERINLGNWQGELPVIVCGVTNGVITEDGNGSQEFNNIHEAIKVFPSLNIKKQSDQFTKGMGNLITGKIRFETWKASVIYSS